MTIKSKLMLLGGLPMSALILCLLASAALREKIERGVHELKDTNAVLADTARQLQTHVVQVQQFLTDISATRGLDGLDGGFDAAKEHYDAFQAGLNQLRAYYSQVADTQRVRDTAALRVAFEKYYEDGFAMAEMYVNKGPAEGNKLMPALDAAALKLTADLDPFVRSHTEASSDTLKHIVTASARAQRFMGGIVIVLMVVTGTAMFLILRSTLPSLTDLTRAANEIAAGRLHHRIGNDREDEFGAVAKSFDRMLDSLQATMLSKSELEGIVRHRTLELDALFNESADAMCVGDFEGSLVRVNPAFAAMLDYSQEEMLKSPPEQIVHPEDFPRLQAELTALAKGQTKKAKFDVRGRTKSGDWKTLSWTMVSVPELQRIYGIARDVTEVRRTAKALRESEENLATTLHSIGDGVLVTDAQERITRLNPVAEELTGWTSAEAAGRPVDNVFRIINEETRQPAVVPVAGVIASGKVVGLANHTVLLRRDGSERPIADSCAPIRDSGGKVIGTVLVFRDVSEERAAADKLRESETMLRMLANNLPSGATYRLIRHDNGSARFEYVSESIERLVGVKSGEILADPQALYCLIHEDEQERIVAIGNQAQNRMAQFDCQTRLRTREGAIKWVHWRSSPHKLSPSETAWDGLIVDITPLKRAESELRQLNETLEATVQQRTAELWEGNRRHQTLLANLQGVAYRCRNDHAWTMEYVSEGCRTLLGLAAEDFTSGKITFNDVMHPEDRARVWGQVQAALGKQKAFALEYRVQHASGEWRWVWEKGCAVTDESGQILALEGFITDITTRKRANDALVQQGRRLSSLFRAMPTGVGVSRQRVITQVNERLCELSGYGVKELVGQSTRVFYATEEDFEFAGRDLYARVRESGIANIESLWRKKQGNCFPVLIQASALDPADPMLITFSVTDITRRKHREREMERLNRLYAALNQVNQVVVRALSREEVFEKVCHAVLRYGGFKAAWVAWLDPQTRAVNPVASCGELEEVLRDFRIVADERPEGHGPTGTAIRESRTVVCNQLASDPSTIPWHELAAKHGVGSAASFPIRIGEVTRGALVLYAAEPEFFREREILLLEEAASDVSFALNVLENQAQRRQAEEALRQQEARLSSVFRALPAGVGVARNRVFTEVNQRVCEMFGYTKDELLGQRTRVLYASDEEFQRAGRELYGAMHECKSGQVEARMRRKNGEVLNALINSSVLDPADPAVITFTVTDVSSLKLAEARIRTLSLAIEQSPVSVMITDPQGLIEYVNPRFTQVTGYSAAEVCGQNPRLLKSGETQPAEYARMWNILKQGGAWSGQFKNRKKNGALFWELASISPIRDEGGIVTHFVAIKEDITERRASLEREREQAALLDQTQDAIFVVRKDRRIKFHNRRAEEIYGQGKARLLEELADNFLFPAETSLCAEACKETFEKGEWSGEISRKSATGEARIIRSRWTAVRNFAGQVQDFLVINTDITEQKSLEQQFLRAQRMESLGTLASGVAHDLNNVLAPILVTIELLRPLARDNDDQELLAMLEKGVHRGAGIVRQLLTFGRGVEGQRGEIQPRILLKEMAKIIQETFPKSVVFTSDLPTDLWHINADATQIHQVLLNLCVNARDAMPQGGRLTLAAENLILDELYAQGHSEAKPGPYVVLQVGDTGTGIPSELLDKIFDPFFTTKPPGKGTGLGLSTVLGIVKSHGGFVEVFSRPGEGTQFKVYFPALQQSVAMPDASPPQRLPRGNGELILVVDDEEAIRGIARRMLEKSGYRVLIASNGADGVAAFSQHQSGIQVVLTDMIMPVMDGATFIRVLRGYSLDLKIVAMSGLPLQGVTASDPHSIANASIQKPFTAERLLEVITGLLRTKV